VLGAIGWTPLVRMERLFPGSPVRMLAKLEALNPGGSIKDRPARAILEDAMARGRAGSGTVIIESSSGNMGIGLAQACRYHGLRFICVVDPRTTALNLKLLRAYGAEIDLVSEPEPLSGEFLQARIQRVEELLRQIPGAFWPNQYANYENARAHYRTTMHEIVEALDGRLDALFVATSTCGTLRGCAEYARDHALGTRIIAVDAVGSLIFGNVRAERLIPGLGAGMRPPLCDVSLVDECVHVTDLDCLLGCRRLLQREAILGGGSSGAVVSALGKLRHRLAAGSVCVAIMPDRGERYLDTLYDDQWVARHFGDVAHLTADAIDAIDAVDAEEVCVLAEA
jgi:cysteine synthase A